jgi:CheY-like chemotaxis protein
VAKILVADDNSNIQKMVGLALKDHGIDVIAVGNGEAAVRKISDIHPDLVLADVFMPVRNGYEVCKYVKDDPELKHIPVILLVGAFDPLDEQEAQRVGADGVLKKPFVPPDPLISMVKSALVRAGVAHAGFVPAKAVAEAPVEAPAAPTPESRSGRSNFAPKPTATLPEFETESFVDEAPARPAALKIESGQQAVAFGSLLETPGTDTEEEPSEVTAVPALERDWRTEEVEEEEEEEDADAKPSWRRDAGSEDSGEDVAASGSGWRDAASEEGPARGNRHSGWTPTREKADLTEAAEVQENVHTGISDFRNMPAAPFSGEAWAAAIEAGVQNKAAVAEEEHPAPHAAELEAMVGHAEPVAAREESFVSEAPVSEHVASQGERSQAPVAQDPVSQEFVSQQPVSDQPASEQFVSEAQVVAPEKEPEPVEAVPVLESSTVVPETVPAVEAEKTSSTTSWFSTPPPSPWDAEAQKATKLASTWDAPVAPAIRQAPEPEPASAQVEEALPETPEVPSAFATAGAPDEIEVVSGAATSAVIPEAVETAREEAAHGATELDIDAVVARVLERMSPDRLQEVARDLLKPVIETIVREELTRRR